MSSTTKQVYSEMEEPPMAVPISSDAVGQWKVDVTRASTNLMTDCCPCAPLSDTMSRITKHHKVYGWMLGVVYTAALVAPPLLVITQARSSWAWVAVLVAFLVLAALVVTAARYQVRSFFGIPGNPAEDCFFSCFCMPYTIAQMKAQVEDVPVTDISSLPAYQA
ncbi:hypothetical protein AaE_005348 [Aphanomyces astaci]|uniref:Uncharacterized protein n=3 Tax=Aphanomyces astaci TaxID=112090 RepID=A0A6A5AMP9_APHAT|nr:hypothetical protein AaE_005348 [Aphanomyces astaci]